MQTLKSQHQTFAERSCPVMHAPQIHRAEAKLTVHLSVRTVHHERAGHITVLNGGLFAAASKMLRVTRKDSAHVGMGMIIRGLRFNGFTLSMVSTSLECPRPLVSHNHRVVANITPTPGHLSFCGTTPHCALSQRLLPQ